MRRSLLVLAGIAVTIACLPAQEPAKPRRIALLIGVNNYEGSGLPSLNHATHDLEALRDQLKNGGFDDIAVLTNLDATKEKIESALAQRVKKRGVGDLMLVAMSGHGMQTRNAKGEEDAFFCPYGCDKSDADTLVSLTDAVQKLGSKGANLLLVDACRNDPKRGVRGIQGDELKDRMPVNTAVLFSCSAGQFSFETTQMNGPNAKEGHGVFFYHVLEGLRGKAANEGGNVSWNRLVDYVQENVNRKAKEWFADEAKERAKGLGVPLAQLRFQSPHQLTNLNESLVLANAAPAAAKPEPRPAPMVAGQPKSGEERAFEIAPGVKMIFCWIPAGKATLGSPASEKNRDTDEAEHEYESKGFWLGKYTVTQAEWKALMDGNNPSHFKGDRLPVERVSWNDCQDFLKKLNERGGVKAVFGSTGKFVLPHEDQWEYACRGPRGNARAFYFGDELNGTQANCNGNYPFGTTEKGSYREKTTEVGHFADKYPHPWGLCDMHGNVYQWCDNNKYSNERRVLRGGSWMNYGRTCRAAYSCGNEPDSRVSMFGFRVCLPLD